MVHPSLYGETLNNSLLLQTFFQYRVPAGCSVFRMEADTTDLETATQRYAQLLPDLMDVFLLGVGEYGISHHCFPTMLCFPSQTPARLALKNATWLLNVPFTQEQNERLS